MAQFNPDWDFNQNDRLCLSNAEEYIRNVVPPQDCKAVESLENKELFQRLALGISQSVVLSSEMITRMNRKNRELDRMRDDLDNAEKTLKRMEVENAYLKKEVKEANKAKEETKKEKTELQVKVSGLTEENASLESKYQFFKGEGASQTVNNFLRSQTFLDFLVFLCKRVKKYGYTKALQNIHEKYPDINLEEEKGYDVKAKTEMNKIFSDLREGRLSFSAQGFVPSSPVAGFKEQPEGLPS